MQKQAYNTIDEKEFDFYFETWFWSDMWLQTYKEKLIKLYISRQLTPETLRGLVGSGGDEKSCPLASDDRFWEEVASIIKTALAKELFEVIKNDLPQNSS